MDHPTVPEWLHGFLDDAAAFPPASRPLADAVAAHRVHLRSEYADLVGRLVVADVRLPELIDVVEELDAADDGAPALPINLLVTGGAGALGPAVRWATGAPLLELGAIELLLRDEDDLAHNAQRWVAALGAVDADLSEVPVYAELPGFAGEPSRGWFAALDVIAADDLRTKFRATSDDPDPAGALAVFLEAALDRELPVKVTGAAAPVTTGAGEIGFLNALVATRACLDGHDPAGALRTTSAAALLSAHDTATLLRTRRWLVSCSHGDILEAHDELVDLGLITPE